MAPSLSASGPPMSWLSVDQLLYLAPRRRWLRTKRTRSCGINDRINQNRKLATHHNTHDSHSHVYKCLHHMAPSHLSVMCVPVSTNLARRSLRKAANGDLLILHTRTTCYGPRLEVGKKKYRHHHFPSLPISPPPFPLPPPSFPFSLPSPLLPPLHFPPLRSRPP